MNTAAILASVFICAHPGVTDGDTIRCGDGTRVRIWGIQAPERDMATGPAATRALGRLIKGRDLTCYRKGTSHKRVVARCFAGRMDVAREMVRQGHAEDWPKFSKGFYAR